MKSQLEAFIRKQVEGPKPEEIVEILDIFEERIYAKGEVFKEAHTVSREIGFITSGSSKTIIITEEGEERVEGLLTTNNFIVDLVSVRLELETPIEIRFHEPSETLVATHTEVARLLKTNLTFNVMAREYISDRTVELLRWLMMFLTGSAIDRYRFLLENNPLLIEKLPLQFVASIIGVTPTQLSRIRKQKGKYSW